MADSGTKTQIISLALSKTDAVALTYFRALHANGTYTIVFYAQNIVEKCF
jgi:hypothetical protein